MNYNNEFQPDDPPHSSDTFVDTSENRSLLGEYNEPIVTIQSPEDPVSDFSEQNPRINGVPSITCRVCENQIPYQNKTMQHVVRCPNCNEATPIRSAPAGKKFVRCPCNCLLICKVSSNRIACPRPDCGRVIILKPTSSGEATVPAPAGTARICCFYCEEVFMYNTIANQIIRCPHCQKKSSIGIAYTRSRVILYFSAALFFFLFELFLVFNTINNFGSHAWVIVIYIILFILTAVYCQKFATFVRLKNSQILGPV